MTYDYALDCITRGVLYQQSDIARGNYCITKPIKQKKERGSENKDLNIMGTPSVN